MVLGCLLGVNQVLPFLPANAQTLLGTGSNANDNDGNILFRKVLAVRFHLFLSPPTDVSITPVHGKTMFGVALKLTVVLSKNSVLLLILHVASPVVTGRVGRNRTPRTHLQRRKGLHLRLYVQLIQATTRIQLQHSPRPASTSTASVHTASAFLGHRPLPLGNSGFYRYSSPVSPFLCLPPEDILTLTWFRYLSTNYFFQFCQQLDSPLLADEMVHLQ